MIYKDRHKRTERTCEWCGTKFMAQNSRIKLGQGRFCSLSCANSFQSTYDTKDAWGKEKGKKYLTDGRWSVHWRSGSKKVHVTSYPKWWWELNVGEIPKGYVVSYLDGDSENIDPSNFYLITRAESNYKAGKKTVGIAKPSLAGENSKWWRGGSSREGYPSVFSHSLKKRVKIRDSYTCQCCDSMMDSRLLDVHHIDRNTNNNDMGNLVTVCKSCHLGIHSTGSKRNERILYYQSQLGE